MRFRNILIFSIALSSLVILNSIGYPFWDTLKSYGVMYYHSEQVLKNSYLNKQNIVFKIPGGTYTSKKDWYPFMLHHDASLSFSRHTGKDLSCLILYSFGSFDFIKGSSNFYNPNSPYQGAFYGGYALFDYNPQNPPFGFDSHGKPDIEEIKSMPLFDQTNLVLPSVGCPEENITFESLVTSMENNISYIAREGWTRIDAIIKTNSPTHTYKGIKNIGYLQYGKPHKKFISLKDYPVHTLHGRIYIKYIKDLKGTFILYVLAKEQSTVEQCDRSLLSHTIIERQP